MLHHHQYPHHPSSSYSLQDYIPKRQQQQQHHTAIPPAIDADGNGPRSPQSSLGSHQKTSPVHSLNPDPHVNHDPAMFPRSASEAIVDTSTKFRQLPCRTFISVGTCPYRERCVYLHDPRCIFRDAKTKTRRKNKDDVVLDSLFWPIMSNSAVSMKLDNNRQPHVIQPYVVPPPQNDQFRSHDEAVYSLWMHFVDFCLANSESQHAPYPDAAPCFLAPDLPINAYTKLPRLPVFRLLSASAGREIHAEEYAAAKLGRVDIGDVHNHGSEFPAKAMLKRKSFGSHDSTEKIGMPMIRTTPDIAPLANNVISNWAESSTVCCVNWSADGTQIISGLRDNTIKIRKVSTGEVLRTLEGHSGWVNAVSTTINGRKLASASSDGTLKIWDAISGMLMNTLQGHSGWVNAVAWSTDGSRLVSGSNDRTLKIWDALSGEVLNTLEGHSDSVSSVCWSLDGTKIVSGSKDATIKVWEAATGRLVNSFSSNSSVTCLSLHPDGIKVSCATDEGSIRIFETTTGRVIKTFDGHIDVVTSVYWSFDGSKIVSASKDRTIKFWQASTGELLETLQGHSSSVTSVSWSVNGKTIVSGSEDKTIKVWEVSDLEASRQVESPTADKQETVWNLDMNKVAMGKKWDVSSGEMMQSLQGPPQWMNAVIWKVTQVL